MRSCFFAYKGLCLVLLAAVLPGVASANFASRVDGMVSTIQSLIDAEDFATAEQTALELTETQPGLAQGWVLLGYCQSCLDKFEESNHSYEQALKHGGDVKAVNLRRAYNFIREGDYDRAKQCYQEILSVAYDDTDALQQLGFVEGALGNYDEAAVYYRKVLQSDPENQEVITALAKIEAKRGGGDAVRELLEKSLELAPDNTEALGRLGLLHIKDKNYKDAIAPLTKLVELDPVNDKAFRNLGVAHYQLGNKGKALAAFEQVRALGGDIDDLYGPMADCYMATGRNADALSVIKQGIDGERQQAWLYCMWGKILEKSGNYDGAIAKFARAANAGEAPWSGYARKQIARQEQLKQRAELISSQQGM